MSTARRGAGNPQSPGSADSERRQIAVSDFDRNLVVTAGAGTGKTALLVERALNLIAGQDLPVQSLAAITFTEKAAAELRERLATGLEALHRLAATAAEPEQADREGEAARSYQWLRIRAGVAPAEIARRSLQALLDLDVASVCTVHAFCAEILRRYPMQAGVDPDFEIDEGGSFDSVFERESARFLADELGPRARRAALWGRVLSTTGGLGATREIGAMLGGFRLPTATLGSSHTYTSMSVRDALGPDLSELHDAIARTRRGANGMNLRMDQYLETAQILILVALEQGPAFLGRVSTPWSLEDFLDKGLPSPGAALRNADPNEVREMGQRARRLIKALLAVDEQAVGAIVDAARPLAASARQSVLRAGLVSFDGLLRLTRDLLAAHPVVRRELARRYRAILLDEFQDTDPLQYEILFFIAEENGDPADDPYRARLGQGRLFIVGDPKQSIYRFRRADIEAYQRAVRHVLECGGRSIVLSSSFRSPADIVEPINRIFAPWMSTVRPDDDRFQPPYERIDSARGPAAHHTPRVEIWSVEAEGGAVARRRAEAEALAGWIAARRGAADVTGEPLRYGDVAILLRALTHAGLYAQALRRAGVPFIVDGGKDFYERPEVGDLIALLRAVANPNDGPAILAVMRSVLGGVPDGELARFAAAGGRFDLPREGSGPLTEFPNVSRTLSLIESLRTTTRGRAVDEVVRAAVSETPLAVLHAAAFEGAQRVANLGKLAVEVEVLARRGLSLEEVIRTLEDEFRSDRDGGESPLADETLDAVRVLSIHKAKGLQYPLVIVPDVGRQEKGQAWPRTELAWLRSDSGSGLAVKLKGGVTNVAWVKHAEESRRHEAAEEKRVFYVACTRPRERLILVNSNMKKGRVPWREALATLGYTVDAGVPTNGTLAPDILHRRIVAAPATEHAPGSDLEPAWEQAVRAFQDVQTSATASAAPPLRWPAGTRDALLAGSGEHEDPTRRTPTLSAGTRSERSTARLAGMAFHAAMEWWDFKDGARLREGVRRDAARIAREAATPSAEDVPALAAGIIREAVSITDEFLRSPLPRRLATLAILGREVPILYRDTNGTTWVGACDVLYLDEDGTIVVADYKTDRMKGDAARAAEPYRDQLRVYREAVSRSMKGTLVRAEVLFVRTGDVVVMG